MKSSQAFAESFINSRHFLLGRELKPLCLRHLLWLDAVQSPLLHTAKPVAMSDVEVAALICSSGPQENLETLFAVQELSFFSRIRRKLWHRANRGRDLRAAVAAFLDYQDDYLALPETFDKREGGTKGATALPYLLMAAAVLIRATGWSEETVFNMAIGKVYWLNRAFGYLETGETDVLSDADHEAKAALAALTSGAKEWPKK